MAAGCASNAAARGGQLQPPCRRDSHRSGPNDVPTHPLLDHSLHSPTHPCTHLPCTAGFYSGSLLKGLAGSCALTLVANSFRNRLRFRWGPPSALPASPPLGKLPTVCWAWRRSGVSLLSVTSSQWADVRVAGSSIGEHRSLQFSRMRCQARVRVPQSLCTLTGAPSLCPRLQQPPARAAGQALPVRHGQRLCLLRQGHAGAMRAGHGSATLPGVCALLARS